MKKGFTLIELLAVIAIIAVIGLLTTPIFMGVINRSRENALQIQENRIIEAAKLHVTENYKSIAEFKTAPYKFFISLQELNDSGNINLPISNPVTKQNINPETYIIEVTKEPSGNFTYSIQSVTPFICGDIVNDLRDTNTYPTVQIGTQCWLAKNLAYTGNGCLDKTWDTTSPDNACISRTLAWGPEIFYQWEAAMANSTSENARGLCPIGWNIPTIKDWSDLITYLVSDPGTKLKSNALWDGTNTVGFNGLPAGSESSLGGHQNSGSMAQFWTSSLDPFDDAHGRNLITGWSTIDNQQYSLYNGRSVRCLKN